MGYRFKIIYLRLEFKVSCRDLYHAELRYCHCFPGKLWLFYDHHYLFFLIIKTKSFWCSVDFSYVFLTSLGVKGLVLPINTVVEPYNLCMRLLKWSLWVRATVVKTSDDFLATRWQHSSQLETAEGVSEVREPFLFLLSPLPPS